MNGSQTHRVRGLVWNRDFKKSWRLNRRKKARLDLKFFVLDSRNPHPPFTHCSVSVVQDSVGTFLNLFIVPNDRIILTQNFHFRLLLFYCVLLNCGFPQPRILFGLPRLVKDARLTARPFLFLAKSRGLLFFLLSFYGKLFFYSHNSELVKYLQ